MDTQLGETGFSHGSVRRNGDDQETQIRMHVSSESHVTSSVPSLPSDVLWALLIPQVQSFHLRHTRVNPSMHPLNCLTSNRKLHDAYYLAQSHPSAQRRDRR
jgi:hypothetical protein